MNAISEFQIYIGSLDSQLNTELVNENEFKEIVIGINEEELVQFVMELRAEIEFKNAPLNGGAL